MLSPTLIGCSIPVSTATNEPRHRRHCDHAPISDVTAGVITSAVTSLMMGGGGAWYPNSPFEINVSGYCGDRALLLIGCHVRSGRSQSVAQQQVRRRSFRSHSRGRSAEVAVELQWRASLLPERNSIGQSLRTHRKTPSCDWLKGGAVTQTKHDKRIIWWQNVNKHKLSLFSLTMCFNGAKLKPVIIKIHQIM